MIILAPHIGCDKTFVKLFSSFCPSLPVGLVGKAKWYRRFVAIRATIHHILECYDISPTLDYKFHNINCPKRPSPPTTTIFPSKVVVSYISVALFFVYFCLSFSSDAPCSTAHAILDTRWPPAVVTLTLQFDGSWTLPGFRRDWSWNCFNGWVLLGIEIMLFATLVLLYTCSGFRFYFSILYWFSRVLLLTGLVPIAGLPCLNKSIPLPLFLLKIILLHVPIRSRDL